MYAVREELEPIVEQADLPDLPADWKQMNTQAIVQVTITSAGQLADCIIVRSSGNKALDDQIVGAVRRWRFKPAMRNGKPVAVRTTYPIDFEIR